MIDLTKPILIKCAGCGHWIEMTRESLEPLDGRVYPPGTSIRDVRTFCDVCLAALRKQVNV